MSLNWFRALTLTAVVALAAPMALFAAAPTNPPRPQGFVSLAGQLLVASPSMSDPRFAHTVVLIVRHDRDGAFGIVINRPAAERPLALVLEAIGEKHMAVSGNVRIFIGGPVQPELAFVIHSPEYHEAGTIEINGRLAVTASREVFRALAGAGATGPQKSLIAFGYAGWSAGQLEAELALNAWYTAPADIGMVFDEDRERLWERATERRTRDL